MQYIITQQIYSQRFNFTILYLHGAYYECKINLHLYFAESKTLSEFIGYMNKYIDDKTKITVSTILTIYEYLCTHEKGV